MRVRCIRKPFPGHLHRPAVTIGSDYVVLMVSATPDSRIVLRILENRREEVSFQKPILRDSRDFELVSSAIPNNWRVAIDERGRVKLGPPSWLDEGFWDDLFGDGPPARRALHEFERELQVILEEDARDWRLTEPGGA